MISMVVGGEVVVLKSLEDGIGFSIKDMPIYVSRYSILHSALFWWFRLNFSFTIYLVIHFSMVQISEIV